MYNGKLGGMGQQSRGKHGALGIGVVRQAMQGIVHLSWRRVGRLGGKLAVMRYDALAARRLLHGPAVHDIEGCGSRAVSSESSAAIGGVRFGMAMMGVRVRVRVRVRMVVALIIVQSFVLVLLNGGNQILGRAGPPGTQRRVRMGVRMHVFLVGMRQRRRRKSVGSSHDADGAEVKDWELALLGRRDRKRVGLVAGGSLVCLDALDGFNVVCRRKTTLGVRLNKL